MALLHLDSEQRSAFSHLDFLASVDAGAIGRRIRQAWAPVSAATDAVIHGYLDALEQWDVTTDLEFEQASAATAAFDAHVAAMRSADADIAAFSERFTSDFVHVTSTLKALAPRRRAAEQAVEQASAALVRAEQAGMLASRARVRLEQAVQHLLVVQAGPVVHGMDTVLRACGDAVAAAHEAAHDLEQLPQLRQRVQHSVTSSRTRLAAVEWRAEQGSGQVLRALRQDYVEGCWQDLDGEERDGAAALATARQRLAAAVSAATDEQQRWHDALSALTEVRAALDEADAHIGAPRDRLELLESVAADPAAIQARARFAVRDAQKLLMSGRVDGHHARALDALAGRLESAPRLLDRLHPDWLSYAHTMDAIVDEAHGLVADIRASRAAR